MAKNHRDLFRPTFLERLSALAVENAKWAQCSWSAAETHKKTVIFLAEVIEDSLKRDALEWVPGEF